MDTALDVNQFPILRQTLPDKSVRKSIRLLTVFGVRGSQVIYVTSEDRVFGFGNNRNSCLGLGHSLEDIEIPILNTGLSGKQLVAIASGFEHCVGLTSSGKCLSWGQNKYGQLGLGHNVPSLTPQGIQELEDHVIIHISCGCSHTLALTNSGQVFAWGSNTFGQLGDRSYDTSLLPTEVSILGSVVSISCGKNHSIALTSDGLVYAWGLNESGQLGRHPDNDIRKGRDKRTCFRPEVIESLSKLKFSKVVCGPNYTLLLTNDGIIYSFGDNTNGQIGNGKTGTVVLPFKMANGPKIKDIITHYENDLSIAVSVSDRCYLWGLADKRQLMNPRLITDRLSAYSLFDIYAKYAKHKITFKNVIITEDMHLEEKTIVEKYLKQYNSSQTADQLFKSFATTNGDNVVINGNHILGVNDLNQMRRSDNNVINGLNKNDFNYNIINDEKDCKLSEIDNSIIYSIVKDIVTDDGDKEPNTLTKKCVDFKKTIGDLFLSRLRHSFNNENNFDLKIIIGQKIIYCHKTVLEIRNKRFWNILRQRLTVDSEDEIRVEPQCYVAFFAFIQYLYGFEPIMDEKIVFVLLSLAKAYDEPELEELCDRFIGGLKDNISVDTLCPLYEKAVKHEIKDLEDLCVQFAANNWKQVFKSDAFQELNNNLSKKLMFGVFDKND